jgi:hypothetical protein
VYEVDAVNPFKIILPVALAQFDGLVNDELLIAGVGFTTTIVDAVADGQFNVVVVIYVAVAITLYVPAIPSVALVLTCGICWVLVKEAGPLQLHVTGVVLVDAVNVKALPVQTGVLDDAVGVAGV